MFSTVLHSTKFTLNAMNVSIQSRSGATILLCFDDIHLVNSFSQTTTCILQQKRETLQRGQEQALGKGGRTLRLLKA